MVSLDGVPGSLLEEAFREGRLGPLASVWKEGHAAPLTSTVPPISSVAWTTYSTGVNPGRHGIFGFVDRDPASLTQYLPTADDVSVPRLWDLLGKLREKSVVINVPLTYPAQPVEGWLVAGFPAPDLSRAAHPPELAARLAEDGYLVDPDPGAAADPPGFFRQVELALQSRERLAMELLEKSWDFFHLHIMATDRLNHFFLADGLAEGPNGPAFWRAYERVAELVKRVVDRLPDEVELVLMSDHGFCALDWEVDLNAYLAEVGLLTLSSHGEGPARLAPGSVAYSLTPGRIYLLRRGRERGGWISPGEAPARLGEVASALRGLKTPEGKPAIANLIPGSELYLGPKAELGPDLVAIPAPGVELRGGWSGGEVARRPGRQGGHTLEGAFLWLRGRCPRQGTVLDVPATLWRLLGLRLHPQLEGQVLLS